MAAKQIRAEQTRDRILAGFRSAFLALGYEAATTDTVLAKLGLSKGALYHHFASKAAIIRALYERESHTMIAKALASTDPEAPALAQLKQACLGWLALVRAPDVARILFEIGPAALGYREAKEIEGAHSLGHFERLLTLAVAQKETSIADTAFTANMLNALMGEAAIYSLRTRRDCGPLVEPAIDGLLSGLNGTAGG